MPIVPSLQKSLSVLESVFQSKEGAGTRTLARRLHLNVATVHNIAKTFCETGYLRQDPATKCFFPGLRLMMLGRHPSYLRTLPASADPILKGLAEEFNESILLGAFEHGRVVNLRYLPSTQALRVYEPEDMDDHAHCTAVGKVLLASMPDHELKTLLQETRFKAFTPRTLTLPAELMRSLHATRKQGYARTKDEYCEGVSAVAVPIADPWQNVIAAIGASAPTFRLDKGTLLKDTILALKKAATEIEKIWGATLVKPELSNSEP